MLSNNWVSAARARKPLLERGKYLLESCLDDLMVPAEVVAAPAEGGAAGTHGSQAHSEVALHLKMVPLKTGGGGAELRGGFS